MTIRPHVLQMALLTDTNAIQQSLSSVQDGAVVHALSPWSWKDLKLQVKIENMAIRQHVLQMAWLTDTNAIAQSLSSVQDGIVVQPMRPRPIS